MAECSNGVVEIEARKRNRLKAIRLSAGVDLRALKKFLVDNPTVTFWRIDIHHTHGVTVTVDNRQAVPGSWLVEALSGDIGILNDASFQEKFSVVPALTLPERAAEAWRGIEFNTPVISVDPDVTDLLLAAARKPPTRAAFVCNKCNHSEAVHSPVGCWNAEGVVRCACRRSGSNDTRTARKNASG